MNQDSTLRSTISAVPGGGTQRNTSTSRALPAANHNRARVRRRKMEDSIGDGLAEPMERAIIQTL
ncbi:hypothetical protein D9M71_711950 [compost metagenome]